MFNRATCSDWVFRQVQILARPFTLLFDGPAPLPHSSLCDREKLEACSRGWPTLREKLREDEAEQLGLTRTFAAHTFRMHLRPLKPVWHLSCLVQVKQLNQDGPG